MHGHQGEIIFWGHYALGRADGREFIEHWNWPGRPAEVETHEPGKNHADENGKQRQRVVLLADHFVIEAKDVLTNKTGWRRVLVCGVRCGSVMHV